MAFRLRKHVVKGEIDNRFKGHVMGKIWLLDREEPVKLNLKGNCLRDIAGLKIVFENPSPEQAGEKADLLHPVQEGTVGDMTASRKVKTFDMPAEEAYDMRKAGKEVPLRTANCLYLEWFSERNGRVVIEMTDFRVKELSEPKWRMSKEEEHHQAVENLNAIKSYMERCADAREEARAKWSPDEDEPMNEFEWEKSLKESDNLTDRAMEVFEKYMDHPDSDKLIAREMGWEWLDDALDADERGVFDEEKEELKKGMEDIPPLEPDPLTEGVNWIRTDDDNVKHPLSHRAFNVAMTMWHKCKDRGLLGEEGDEDLHDMLFQAQTLGTKLAGALDSLAYDYQPEGGFVVAYLKRGLQYFDKAIAASNKVRTKDLLDANELEDFQKELFTIREEMLVLMKHFRSTM